ncbi:TetR/AcrR family transcriptional regulator [Mucilaginibacter sp. dw_454]|uniref:TetR/AcrR family transcriptional regulator n=1 Tax=Mucilaginibacter sp. dw_454 TaxID=2720079 RepID=UPI001BD3CAC5|nr:TetR/AcrR family transcriptional regulator [Mucilaginibacter sp. dw_454]
MTKAERTRQFIIEKAAPIFNQKGIAGTSMSDVMEATKLAKGGVYGNFESKEALCLEVFAYLSKLTQDEITLKVNAVDTAKDKLYVLLDSYAHRVLKENYGGCPILNFGAEADDTNPLMKQKVNEAIIRFKNRFSKIITDGQASGELSEKFDAELFGLKAFTMIEGGILISKVQNNPGHMHTIIALLKKEIDQFIN